MTIDSVFIDRFQSERLRLKLSRAEVADCMGVQSQTVIQYEKGLSSPTLANVRKLKKIGFDLDYLMDIDNISPIKINEIDESKLKKTTELVDEVENIISTALNERQRLELGLLFLSKIL